MKFIDLHPDNIIMMEKIISLSVWGAMFPKPTETSAVNTK